MSLQVVGPPNPPPLTAYERRVLAELQAWKSPPNTRRSRAGDRLEKLVEDIASRLPTKFLDELFERGLPVLNRAAKLTAPRQMVLASYRRHGHQQVVALADIEKLSLEEVERVVGTKRLQELAKGAAEGGIAGFYGAPGAAADVPALLALALRNVNVFAYSYGFDADTDEERAFALSVISASAAFGSQAKQVARAGIGVGGRMAGKDGVKRLLERLPKQLMLRLAAINTSKAAPVAGALTGGAFNAWFLRNVAIQARFAYRQRFLERRHGPEVLDAFGL